MASNFIYIHSDQPVNHYIYRCLSGKLWYLPQKLCWRYHSLPLRQRYTLYNLIQWPRISYIFSDQPVNHYIYRCLSGKLWYLPQKLCWRYHSLPLRQRYTLYNLIQWLRISYIFTVTSLSIIIYIAVLVVNCGISHKKLCWRYHSLPLRQRYTLYNLIQWPRISYIFSDQPVNHYIYRCLSGKLWYLPQKLCWRYHSLPLRQRYTLYNLIQWLRISYIVSDQPVNHIYRCLSGKLWYLPQKLCWRYHSLPLRQRYTI